MGTKEESIKQDSPMMKSSQINDDSAKVEKVVSFSDVIENIYNLDHQRVIVPSVSDKLTSEISTDEESNTTISKNDQLEFTNDQFESIPDQFEQATVANNDKFEDLKKPTFDMPDLM